MDTTIEIGAAAAAAFIIIKILFAFLGWYSRDLENGDPLYRRMLDALWDRMQRLTLRELAHRALKRLLVRLQATFRNRRRALIWFFVLSIGLNFLSLPVAQIVGKISMGMTLTEVIQQSSVSSRLLFLLIIVALGACFDLLSLLVTLWLIKRAASKPSLARVFAHIAIDIVVATVAVTWMGGAIMVADFVFHLIEGVGMQPLGELVTWLLPDWASVLVLGATAALPTLCYCFILLAHLLVWSTPHWLQRLVHHVVFLLASDKKPVLGQIGTFLGALAAFLAAVVTLMSRL